MATAFGLTYDIPTLLAHSSLHGCVLVLDGFEHLEGELSRLRSAVYLLGKDRPEVLRLLGQAGA